MNISPWYSIDVEVEEGEKKDIVHHHNSMCKVGKKVDKNHHRYGTDNRPLCKVCARLDGLGH
jgi:hypothetical protein